MPEDEDVAETNDARVCCWSRPWSECNCIAGDDDTPPTNKGKREGKEAGNGNDNDSNESDLDNDAMEMWTWTEVELFSIVVLPRRHQKLNDNERHHFYSWLS